MCVLNLLFVLKCCLHFTFVAFIKEAKVGAISSGTIGYLMTKSEQTSKLGSWVGGRLIDTMWHKMFIKLINKNKSNK